MCKLEIDAAADYPPRAVRGSQRETSPLRIVISAQANSGRSIEANSRLKIVAEGAKPSEAVFDMRCPLLRCSRFAAFCGQTYVYQIPGTTIPFAAAFVFCGAI